MEKSPKFEELIFIPKIMGDYLLWCKKGCPWALADGIFVFIYGMPNLTRIVINEWKMAKMYKIGGTCFYSQNYERLLWCKKFPGIYVHIKNSWELLSAQNFWYFVRSQIWAVTLMPKIPAIYFLPKILGIFYHWNSCQLL